jgi:hypothetical protein
MMASDFLFVTGNLDVGDEIRAKQVLEAFQSACKGGSSTIYVIGRMFDPDTSQDAAVRFMKELPGRKVLVADTERCALWEAGMSDWYEVNVVDVIENLWGHRLILSPCGRLYQQETDITLHVNPEVIDTSHTVNVAWDQWQDGQYGPGGLQSMYAMAVYAEQLGTHLAMPG